MAHTEVAAPSMVVFSWNGNTNRTKSPILTSWEKGPQKSTGFEKRGRPKIVKSKSKCVAEKEETKFGFVNYTDSTHKADLQDRKTVRSHAMLSYRREERKKKVERIEVETRNRGRPETRPADVETKSGEVQPVMRKPSLQEITNVDPFNAFPVQIEPFMMELLLTYSTAVYEAMYTVEKQMSYNPVKDVWIPMAFAEPALLYAICACSDDYCSRISGRQERPSAIMHLKQAIQIVNSKLDSADPDISDATIVVVCALAYAEKMNGNINNWRIHMRGLKQMVDLRGGMQDFRTNNTTLSRMVHNKINRSDLCGSIDLATAPYLEPPIPISTITEYQMVTLAFPGVDTTHDLPPALTPVLMGLQIATQSLTQAYVSPALITIHPLDIREQIISLQYALLSTPPLSGVHEVLRLSLLLYLVTLANEPFPGTANCAILGQSLQDLLCKEEKGEGISSGFRLWVCFLAAAAGRGSVRGWFVVEAGQTARDLGWRTWDVVEKVLKGFFWVEGIHDVRLRELWGEMMSGS